jgi:glycerophosphoryl diester phosphodiesterase
MNVPLRRPFGNRLPVVVGHRGAPRLAPENTPACFAAAAEAGASWVELDVRRCADGLVVCHDPALTDLRPLLDLGEQDLRVRGVWSLAEVLEGMPAGLGVDVELKNMPQDPDYDEQHGMAPEVARLVRRAAERRPVFVSSFNPFMLTAIAVQAPEIPLGLLHGDTLRAPAGLALAQELGAAVLCPQDAAPGLDAELVAAAHRAGIAVMVWTVDDLGRARSLAEMGVDAICTNEPAALAEMLRRRP